MSETELPPSPIVRSRAFDEPALEAEFRRWGCDAEVAFFRRVALILGIAFFGFAVPDFFTLEPEAAFQIAVALRLPVLVAFLFVWYRLAEVDDFDTLERLTLPAAAVLLVFVAAIHSVILRLDPLLAQSPYSISVQLICVLGVYLFLPNGMVALRFLGWSGAVLFLVVPWSAGAPMQPVGHVFGLFVLVNVLGELLARRRSAQHRAQFLSIRAETEMNTRLRAEVESRERLETQRNRIFSMIGHDLRSPLSTMIGMTEILAEDVKDLPADEVVSLARATHRNARVLLDLLDNLLQWGRLQTGRLRFSPAAVDLSVVVGKVLALLEPTAREKHVRLESEGLPVSRALGDATMLATVIRNLAANGIKFTPSGGTVRIVAEELGDFVEIRVIDTGVGIASEALTPILESGPREAGVGTAGEPGTGLGLQICREFLARHGCQLEVESLEGEGSTFRFRLPTVAAASDAEPAPDRANLRLVHTG